VSRESLAIESVLVAEFGRDHTRAYLVDMVDGVYRFLARGEAVSTLELPHDDLTIGLQGAVQQVEYIAGRKLLQRDRLKLPQAANGDGVDAFIAVANVGDPLRLVILDAGAEPAEVAAITEAVRRQEALAYTVLPPGRGVKPAEWAIQQGALVAGWHPQALLLVTGPTPAAETLERMIDLIKGLAGPATPGLTRLSDRRDQLTVLAAMSEETYAQVAEGLAARVNLRLVGAATPAALGEGLATELGRVADERAAVAVPGYEAIGAWSSTPVVSRQRAAGLVLQYLAAAGSRRVAMVDLEAAASVYVATPDRATGAVVADLDLGTSASNLLTRVTPAALSRWLPFDAIEADLIHWLLNRSLRPLTAPVTARDQLIEQALARETVHVALERLEAGGAQGADLLVGSQRLGQWNNPAAAAAVLLDGVQPTPGSGAVTLVLDAAGLLPALGALAQAEPAIAAAVLEGDALTPLGTCLVVQGGSDGQRVVSGTIRRAGGERQEIEVTAGGLAVVPLAFDETASIRLTLGNRATLGAVRSGQTVEFAAPAHVRGGRLGLIIDARGRPLPMSDDARRRHRVRDWLVALGVISGTETLGH
jgi:hypothetical protein